MNLEKICARLSKHVEARDPDAIEKALDELAGWASSQLDTPELRDNFMFSGTYYPNWEHSRVWLLFEALQGSWSEEEQDEYMHTLQMLLDEATRDSDVRITVQLDEYEGVSYV